jgi:hypothetical protein
MERHVEEIVTDTHVRVVLIDDIDPRATTPLWASVRRIAADSSTPHAHPSTGQGGIVIEVSESPPAQRRTGRAGRNGGRSRPAPRGATDWTGSGHGMRRAME